MRLSNSSFCIINCLTISICTLLKYSFISTSFSINFSSTILLKNCFCFEVKTGPTYGPWNPGSKVSSSIITSATCWLLKFSLFRLFRFLLIDIISITDFILESFGWFYSWAIIGFWRNFSDFYLILAPSFWYHFCSSTFNFFIRFYFSLIFRFFVPSCLCLILKIQASWTQVPLLVSLHDHSALFLH